MISINERQDKIAFLARVNRCIQSAQGFLEGLSLALGEPVDQAAVLSLRETDEVNAAYRVGYGTMRADGSAAFRRYFSRLETAKVFQLAARFADQLPDEQCLLLARQKDDCGAIQTRLDLLLRHTASMIKFDGDSLCAISMDRNQGLLIDNNPDDHDQTYEITVWGSKWPAVIASCER